MVAEGQLFYSSQFPVPSSGTQNTPQIDLRNLAHLQNRLLLSLAHYQPKKICTGTECPGWNAMCFLLVSIACTRMFLFQLLLFVHQPKSKTHRMVFVNLVPSRGPVRTVQTSRKMRVPMPRRVRGNASWWKGKGDQERTILPFFNLYM